MTPSLDRIILPPLVGLLALYLGADALPDLIGVVVGVAGAVYVAAVLGGAS